MIEIVRYALFMENQMQAQRPPAPRPLRRPRAAEPGRGPARRPDEGSDGSDSDPGPSSSSSQRQLRSRRKRAFQVSSQESGGAADDFSFDHSEDPSTTTLDVPSTSSLPPSSSARAEKDADTSEDEESSGRPIPKRYRNRFPFIAPNMLLSPTVEKRDSMRRNHGFFWLFSRILF